MPRKQKQSEARARAEAREQDLANAREIARCIVEADQGMSPKNRRFYMADDYHKQTGRDFLTDVVEMSELITRTYSGDVQGGA